MKKKVNHCCERLLSLLLTLLGFGACASLKSCTISAAYGGPPEEYSVKVIPSVLSFPAEGGKGEIKIETDGNWTITSETSYINVSHTSGKGDKYVEVSVTENPIEQSRYSKVMVVGTSNSVSVNIVQDAGK